jgi:dCTP diphosphatase
MTDEPPDDFTTTLADLRAAMRTLVEERDWSQFHRPKNLAMSIAIEAAELMEHFQWDDAGTSPGAVLDTERKAAIGEEMADVLAYLVSLANSLDLDLASTFHAKLAKVRLKYPVDQFRGRAR